MRALEVAHAFGRYDVDAFLAEIEFGQLIEWGDYFTLRPTGWQAFNHVAKRLGYITAQVHSRKRLDEHQFEVKPCGNVFSAEERVARARAGAIKSQVRERVNHGKAN